jgi:hypothetical protein
MYVEFNRLPLNISEKYIILFYMNYVFYIKDKSRISQQHHVNDLLSVLSY